MPLRIDWRSMVKLSTSATATVVLALALHGVIAVAAPRIEAGRIVAEDGHTLYVFDNDVVGSGKIACTGPCAGVHPAYLAKPGEVAKAPWSFVVRDDGSRQWAYKGRPLYRFYADEKKGDVGGDGLLRNTWHTARP
jgi:predicted lipoprotein with Yx(FWY)xxD motif